MSEVAQNFPGLLQRAQKGDESAFADLWRHYNPMILRFLATLADRSDIEEVASSVWVDVVRRLGSFQGDHDGFRAWVFTIARSRLVDLRRARSSRVPTAPSTDVDIDRPDERPGPEALAVDASGTDRAITLIATLPESQREVLMLRIVGDFDVARTAEILNKSPGAVRVLCHRGLQRLAELLEVTP